MSVEPMHITDKERVIVIDLAGSTISLLQDVLENAMYIVKFILIKQILHRLKQ